MSLKANNTLNENEDNIECMLTISTNVVSTTFH